MKLVTLRELATVDLSRTYARQLGGNKIRHYKLGLSAVILGIDPKEALKTYIEKEEGEAIELEILPHAQLVGHLSVAPFPQLLEQCPEIHDALTKRYANSAVLQIPVFRKLSLKERTLNFLARYLNPLIDLINVPIVKLQYKLYNIDTTRYWNTDESFTHADEMELMARAGKVKKIRPIPTFDSYLGSRAYSVTQLCVAFEQGQEEKATKVLLDDLNKCYQNDLILGCLTLPSTILLADTIGAGKGQFALFCLLFLDYEKIAQMSGVKVADLPLRPASLLNLRTECHEGEIRYLEPLDYEIETVFIMNNYDEHRNKVIQQHQENMPLVNAAADRMREELKKRNGQ